MCSHIHLLMLIWVVSNFGYCNNAILDIKSANLFCEPVMNLTGYMVKSIFHLIKKMPHYFPVCCATLHSG